MHVHTCMYIGVCMYMYGCVSVYVCIYIPSASQWATWQKISFWLASSMYVVCLCRYSLLVVSLCVYLCSLKITISDLEAEEDLILMVCVSVYVCMWSQCHNGWPRSSERSHFDGRRAVVVGFFDGESPFDCLSWRVYIHMCMCVYINMNMRMCVYININMCMCVYIYINMCMCVYINIHVY